MLLDIEDSEASKSVLSYFFVKLSFRSQTIMGKFVRSLNVGKMTEYLFLDIDANRGEKRGRGMREIGAENCDELRICNIM